MTTRARAIRKLDTGGCPFCCQPNSVELWVTISGSQHELDHPYQVRCSLCRARGPACDCGEESAVPMWLNAQFPATTGRPT